MPATNSISPMVHLALTQRQAIYLESLLWEISAVTDDGNVQLINEFSESAQLFRLVQEANRGLLAVRLRAYGDGEIDTISRIDALEAANRLCEADRRSDASREHSAAMHDCRNRSALPSRD
jgi:hypothetical protein